MAGGARRRARLRRHAAEVRTTAAPRAAARWRGRPSQRACACAGPAATAPARRRGLRAPPTARVASRAASLPTTTLALPVSLATAAAAGEQRTDHAPDGMRR